MSCSALAGCSQGKVAEKDGKVYVYDGTWPEESAVDGVKDINLNLFEQAGLIENGKPKVPNTWQELAETAKVIREKTGKAGYALPTINNQGGWHFINIAWSYGVEFMKQENDGSYTATFDSQEMRDVLQYMYDLKCENKE